MAPLSTLLAMQAAPAAVELRAAAIEGRVNGSHGSLSSSSVRCRGLTLGGSWRTVATARQAGSLAYLGTWRSAALRLAAARTSVEFNSGISSIRSAVEIEGETVVEEPAVAEEALPPSSSEEASPQPQAEKARRGPISRQRRRVTLDMKDIQVGQSYEGKVKTVVPYGCFVDIGTFTDGLVHISELSNEFVDNVENVVSIGQTVTVWVKEVDKSRLSLSMRDRAAEKEAAKSSSSYQEGDENAGGDRPFNRGKVAGRGNRRPPKDDAAPTHNFKKGQKVNGVVKSLTKFGAFVELQAGVEGLVHTTEVADGGLPLESQLSVGQEVEVRILKVERGKISLSMKGEVDLKGVNSGLSTGGAAASNPFVEAFRRYNLIPESEPEPEPETQAEAVADTASDTLVKADEPEEVLETAEPIVAVSVDSLEQKSSDVVEEQAADPAPTESPAVTEDVVTVDAPTAEETIGEEIVNEPEPVVAESVAAVELQEAVETTEPAVVEAEMPVEVTESAELEAEMPVEAVESAEAVEAVAVVEGVAEEDVPEVVKSDEVAVTEAQPEVPEVAPIVDSASEPVVAAPPPVAATETSTSESTAGGISAAAVKALREETGAGMMACKKALAEAAGNLEVAKELLRKKGLASAEKKASRIATEGLVHSYIHDGRIGVLVEVNCETDFVSRGNDFRQLVEDLGMQIAACPEVEVVSVEDLDPMVIAKEREIEMQREDLASKPEAIRAKIVDGRIGKVLNKFALLEQPYIKDDKVLVKDLIKESVAKLGEKIQVRRFQRFNLGEGLQKKSSDFAAEVAAAATVNTAPKVEVPPPSPVEAAESAAEEAPKVVVSAALVKELRESTGAGMMDCKKALAATDNNLEKATEFLRKKGLASAEKKSSRAATEGLIGSYIHDGRIGVMVEVNCETDFVARGDKFQELVKELAMQVVACPQVDFVSVDDIDPEVAAKEREIAMGEEDLLKKPEAIRAKVVDGRMAKRLGEFALLEQPYIRNDKLFVKDLIKETVASLGENIQVRRFKRYTLGEGLEKKSSNFADEVAAVTNAA